MSQPPSDQGLPETTPDVFRPSWARAALAAVVAIGAFFIPQEIPLEYYPLNDPSSGLQYFEITCGANFTGNVRVLLNTGRGFNDLERIEWPIGPSEMAFTYTFPLADAPLVEIQLIPIDRGPGELTITNCRIINRREEEIHRFTRQRFIPIQDITAIEPLPNGWKIVTTEKDHNPRIGLTLTHPLVAEGMTLRNVQRSLLSTSYLAMMLWIILLAVFFAFRRPEPWRLTVQRMAFLALLGVFFSFVGNRGLIRNTLRFAAFTPPWRLEVEMLGPEASIAKLYWDSGDGFSETLSVRAYYQNATAFETLTVPLPEPPLRALRFDPTESAGRLTLRGARILDPKGRVRLLLAPDMLEPAQQIQTVEIADQTLTLETVPEANDPNLLFTQDAVKKINELRSDGGK